MDLDREKSSELLRRESSDMPLSPQWGNAGGKFSFGRNPSQAQTEAPKSALIGPWDGASPPSFPTAQFNSSSKPTWEAGAAGPGASGRSDKWAGGAAVPPAAADSEARGFGRWRGDERKISPGRWAGGAAGEDVARRNSNDPTKSTLPVAGFDRWGGGAGGGGGGGVGAAAPSVSLNTFVGAPLEGGGRGRGPRPSDLWPSAKEKEHLNTEVPGLQVQVPPNSVGPDVTRVEKWRPAGRGAGGPVAINPSHITPTPNPPTPGLGVATEALSVGCGRGFAAGRGQGVGKGSAMPGAPGAPAVDRWESATANEMKRSYTGGQVCEGIRYSRAHLQAINRELFDTFGGKLPMPPEATIDYPELLPSEPLPEPSLEPAGHYQNQFHYHRQPTTDPSSPHIPSPTSFQAERMSRWVPGGQQGGGGQRVGSASFSYAKDNQRAGGEHMPRPASFSLASSEPPPAPPPLHSHPMVSPQAFAADQWIYKDPQGIVQGPFTKVDILDWFEAGFFPPELPIKSIVDPDSQFFPLGVIMKMWAHIGAGKSPPGFVPHPMEAAAIPQPPPPPSPRASLQSPAPQQAQPGGDKQYVPEELAGQKLQANPQHPPQPPTPSDLPTFNSAPPPNPGPHPQKSVYMPPNMIPGGGTSHSPNPGQAPPNPWRGAVPTGPPDNSTASWRSTPPPAQQQQMPAQQQQQQAVSGSSSFDPTGGFSPHHAPPEHHPLQRQHQSGSAWGSTDGLVEAPPPPQQQEPPEGLWDDGAAGLLSQPPPPAQQQQMATSSSQQQLRDRSQDAYAAAPQRSSERSSNSSSSNNLQSEATQAKVWGQVSQAQASVVQLSGGLADIQRQQAKESAWPAPKLTYAAPGDYTRSARSGGGMAGLPGPLQELFSKAQRVSQMAATAPATITAEATPAPAVTGPWDLAGESAEVRKKKVSAKGTTETSASSQQQQSEVSKAAPWAAVSSKAPAPKTLREIQEEEAIRAAAQQAQQQHAAAAAAAEAQSLFPGVTLGSVWSKGAPAPAQSGPTVWGAAPSVTSSVAPPLKSILAEEQQRSKQTGGAAPPLPSQQPASKGGATLGDILERTLATPQPPKMAAWGATSAPAPVSKAPKATNLREIMYLEESAADLEGGTPDEDLFDLLPPQKQQPQRSGWSAGAAPSPSGPGASKSLRQIQEEEAKSMQVKLKAAAMQATLKAAAPPPAAMTDDDMFWDYGGPAAPPTPPTPPSKPTAAAPKPAAAKPTMTAAAMAARNLPPAAGSGGSVRAVAKPPAPAAATSWGSQATVGFARANAPIPIAAAATASGGGVKSSMVGTSGMRLPVAAAAAASAPSKASSSGDGDSLTYCDLTLSSEFRSWCSGEMTRFFGSSDLTLIKFLLSVVSRSEVADYCSAYMGDKPGASTFVADFLKRRDADVVKVTSSSKKKKGGSKAAANGGGPADWATTAAGGKGKAPPARGLGSKPGFSVRNDY